MTRRKARGGEGKRGAGSGSGPLEGNDPGPRPVSTAGRFGGVAPWLPFLLLAVAVLFVFYLQNFKVAFETGHHGYLSGHGVALARNLSFSHRLLLFHAANIADNGAITLETYNRFPVFPFLAVKAAIAPFEGDLPIQVYAARQAMNLFFSLAMLFSFLALRELLKEPYAALAAVFLTFSSFYFLYYADMVFMEIPALSGFALAAWTAIRSRATGLSRRWTVLAAVASISMGWQPYTVLGTWFLVDLAQFLGKGEGTFAQALRRPASLALFSAIAWGILVLASQIANEAAAEGTGLAAGSTVKMALFRLGLAKSGAYSPYADVLAWGNFLARQAERMVLLFSPASVAPRAMGDPSSILIAQGIILLLFGAGIAGILASKTVAWKPYVVVLVASGFVWALPMRAFVAFHDFQAIFYLGLPLAAFGGLLLFLPRRGAVAAALLAFAFFVFNLDGMNRQKDGVAAMVNPVTYEFEKIAAKLPPGSRVYIDGDKHTIGIAHHAVDCYLAGHYFAPLDRADFVVSTRPFYNDRRLTANQYVNLFAAH